MYVFLLDLFYLLRVAKVCHDSLVALQSTPLRETTECFDVCFQIPATKDTYIVRF